MYSKHIGFDFDGCITESYSIMPVIFFLEVILKEEIKNTVEPLPILVKNALTFHINNFYNNIAENELITGGTIFRPSILKILPELLKQRFEKKIDTLFIYSNNQDLKLINIIDHILALIFTKLTPPVPEIHLIKEVETGYLHTLAPRIHKLAPCRSSEKLIGFSYKEKTFNGIQTCLRKSMNESELLFLDDTRDHTDLVNKLGLGKQYIQTSKYEIKMKNSKIAEILFKSFPKEYFISNNLMGSIFLKAYSKLEKIFIKDNSKLNIIESIHKKIGIDFLTKSLSKISPKATNKSKQKWSESQKESDTKKLRALLNLKESSPAYLIPAPNMVATTAAYGQTLRGGAYNKCITRKKKRKVHEAM